MAPESNSSAIAAFVAWILTTVLGQGGTLVAIVAVAWIGLLMLTGRIDVRRSVQVIAGCFLVFGAATIAAGMMHYLSGGSVDDIVPATSPPPVVAIPDSATVYDPYAGAAVPRRAPATIDSTPHP